MLEDLASLAASKALAVATGTEAGEHARYALVRLLVRRNPEQGRLSTQRLDETCQQVAETDSEEAAEAQTQRQQARLVDFPNEHPDFEGDLRALVAEVPVQLWAEMVSGSDRAVAAGRNVNISADCDGVVAEVIQGVCRNVVRTDSCRPRIVLVPHPHIRAGS